MPSRAERQFHGPASEHVGSQIVGVKKGPTYSTHISEGERDEMLELTRGAQLEVKREHLLRETFLQWVRQRDSLVRQARFFQ